MLKMVRSQTLFGSVALAAVLAAGSVHAQSQGATAPVTAQPAQPADPAKPADATSSSAFGEVIVTAQHRREKLQSVPATVSAFTAKQLDDQHIEKTQDLMRLTVGLNMTQSIYSPQPTIRGIGTRGVGLGDESVVPVFIDGVYQPFLNSLFTDLNNVERVEVLKGPQGALLGRNATGGAINIITRSPEPGFHGDASISYGSFNQAINKDYLTFGTETLAADVAAVFSHSDGYIKDDLTGARYGGNDDIALRSKVLYKPTDRLQFTLAASYSNDIDSEGEAFTPIGNNTLGVRIPGVDVVSQPYHAALSLVPFLKTRQSTVSLTSVYQGDQFTVTALGSYAHNRSNYLNDSDATPAPIALSNNQFGSDSSYEEVYVTTNNWNPIDLIVGGVFYYDDSTLNLFQISRSVSLTGVLGPSAPISLAPEAITHSYAGYVQGTWHITSKLNLILGGRYTTESKDFTSQIGLAAPFTFLAASKSFNKFTPTATLQYQASPSLNLYAKAGQAFKSGIANGAATNATAPLFVSPEEVTQYELGAKWDISRTLRFNVAGYYTDYTNIQVSARDPNNPNLSFLQNAGAATIYGIEAEVFWRPIDRLNIQAGLSALHGEYDNFPLANVLIPNTQVPPANPCALGSGAPTGGSRTAFCNVSGFEIIRAPPIQANLNITYTIPLKSGDEILLNGGLSYQSRSYWDVYNRVPQPSFTLGSASVGYRFGSKHQYEVNVWAENLFNEKYYTTTNISANNDGGELAKPRTVGFELKASF